MQLLPSTAIAAAIGTPAVSSTVTLNGAPRNLTVQANFTYGSGGTTVDAWVQSSIDGGASWTDIAQFHFATASARKAYNLSAATPVTTQASPSDGTLAANTAVDGLLGPLLRVKYASSGTYAGTALRIDIGSIDLPNQA